MHGSGGLGVTARAVVQRGQLTKVGSLGMQGRQCLVVVVGVARRFLLRLGLLLLLVLLVLLVLVLSLLLLVLGMLRVLLLLLRVVGRIARVGRKAGGLRHVGGGGVLVLHVEGLNDVVFWGNNGASHRESIWRARGTRMWSGAGQLRREAARRQL